MFPSIWKALRNSLIRSSKKRPTSDGSSSASPRKTAHELTRPSKTHTFATTSRRRRRVIRGKRYRSTRHLQLTIELRHAETKRTQLAFALWTKQTVKFSTPCRTPRFYTDRCDKSQTINNNFRIESNRGLLVDPEYRYVTPNC